MAGQAARLSPGVGDYLTDGKRLVYVTGVAHEMVEVEDCALAWRDTRGEPVYEIIFLERAALPQWRRVKPDGEA